jgi:predicted TIM-barrel fold metal-dependent hydrolase/SAM-dependent methyltransferase
MILPIFDSLTHPTIDGNWILPKYPQCASMENLQEQMRSNNIKKAFAVGMKGIGSYHEDVFLDLIKHAENLYPIAFFSLSEKEGKSEIDAELKSIKTKGFIGIKLHPCIDNFMLDNPMLPFLIDRANEYKLVILMCTYFYSNKQSISVNNIEKLADLLNKISQQSKIILLHGGSVRLLEMTEIVRSFPNVLLDLSFTFCKYEGSSIDYDISYLFQNFDRRICIGSDYPEISQFNLRKRFDYFAQNISSEKAENIAYKNISEYMSNSVAGGGGTPIINDEDKKNVIDRYTERYKKYGYDPKTLGWDKGKQNIRFNILLSQFNLGNRSILDIGCGFGDLNKYLSDKLDNYSYLGIDIVPDLINEANCRYSKKGICFKCGDFLAEDINENFDYAIGSGIFNFKLKNEDNYEYIERIIKKAFSLCKIGIAFDFLSDKVDYQYAHTFHSSPEKILSIAYKYTRNISLRNDYMPFEFSLFMFKDDGFAKEDTIFNVYKKKY